MFSNVVQSTRQFFTGLPKPAGEGAAAPAQSGAPTPTAPSPSAAAAPQPPRPPSEPIEPEPHIIHKATVMREAAEKRREQPDPEDFDDTSSALSPPSHIIRRPPPESAPVTVSPAPRPPSKAPTPVISAAESPSSRGPTPHSVTPVARPPEHFTPARPPDPYSSSRPPEPYPSRYYEQVAPDTGRPLAPLQSPQPPPRHGSPQSYARMSSSMPSHAARLREGAAHSPPAQRYVMPNAQPPPPHNDRVPPIHHPAGPPGQVTQSSQCVSANDARSIQYQPMPLRREPSPYSRTSHYERHSSLPARKYDHQHAYPGYRPSSTGPQPIPNHRVETHHMLQYKHAPVDTISAHYPMRPAERVPAPTNPYPHETVRRSEYPNMSRPVTDTRSGYPYPSPSTSSARYAPAAPSAVPVVPTCSVPPRSIPRPAVAPKSNYEYPTSNHVQTSPARSTMKPGYPNQQARMTVSVTSLVNQMNQTKQKRESPLDLSVKTVKNSADSSTTQDDAIDSASGESKSIPMLPSSISQHNLTAPGFIASHKVDFAPNFAQCRERSTNHTYPTPTASPGHHSLRYNGAYEARRPAVPTEAYPVESRHHAYPDRKYSIPVPRAEYVPRIDLTRPVSDERRPENRIRDDRNFIIEDRKRPSGPIVSNIPEKIVRYETWPADSRIDRMTQSAREQHDLMSQPVYSYSSHKQFEAYKNEQRRLATASAYRDHHHHPHANHRYPYPTEIPPRDRQDNHVHHHDRNPSISSRQVIQKIPSHRDVHPHHLDPHSGVPADKSVLSILRNSLEIKQTGFVKPAKPARQIPDLIVIDDVDDSVIEITDLTRDNDTEAPVKTAPRVNHGHTMGHHIKMPKAVDSIATEYQNTDSKSPAENDVARIRTKAELKGLPSDSSLRPDLKQDEPVKIVPKSQKQHLFNQIREDRRLESVIKSENTTLPEVKSEPMNIDEIEKDAVASIKSDNITLPLDSLHPPGTPEPEDLDWASACDSFMEQLKTNVPRKKTHRKRIDTLDRDNENKNPKMPKEEPVDTTSEEVIEPSLTNESTISSESIPVIIKQEPIDEYEIKNSVETISSDRKPSDESKCETIVHPNDECKVTNDKNESCEQELKDKIRKTSINAENETEKHKTKSVGRPVVQNLKKKDQENKKKLSPEKQRKDVSAEQEIKKQELKSSNKDQIKMKETITEISEKGKVKKFITKGKSKLQEKAKKLLILQNEKKKCKDDKKENDSKFDDKGKCNKSDDIENSSKSVDKEKSSQSDDTEKSSKSDEKEKSSKDEEKVKKLDEISKSDEKDNKEVKPKSDDKIKSKVKKTLNKSEENERFRGRPKYPCDSEETSKTDKNKTRNINPEVDSSEKDKTRLLKGVKNKVLRKHARQKENRLKDKLEVRSKCRREKSDTEITPSVPIKKEFEDDVTLSVSIKEELESTDDDEPLIKSKMQKEKDIKYQLLKDLSEKSAYVKLECFDVDLNKNTRISVDSLTKEKDDKPIKGKMIRQTSKSKDKILGSSKTETLNDDSSSNSGDEDLTVAKRLRVRKNTKTEEGKSKHAINKTAVKSIPKKQGIANLSSCSTPARKAGFGDGSDFHPGWEEELYKYKRSLRMPTRLIAIPRGRSGGPFVKRLGASFNRGSTSLPDLDPAPLSPAPSSAPSAATDDLYARRQDKLTVDSDLESNSSYSATNRLHYDSEASTSTVFSTAPKKRGSSIVDVLIQKCGKHDTSKKKSKEKEKDEKTPKTIPKSTNPNELLPTPSLGLVKNGNRGILSAKKEKLMEDIFYLGAFRKETVNAYRNAFINNTDGLIGATEEFSPMVLKSRTRTESKVLKQRATIKEVFGDERPASAPPTSCIEEDATQEPEDDAVVRIKEEKEPEAKPKLKPKKIIKEKLGRRSSSIRDGLRSTKSLKRNDAKGRLMRLKKRNSLIIMKSLANKRMKDLTSNKIKKEKPEGQDDNDKPKEEDNNAGTVEGTKRRFKRLFGRRKFSSGFDYIRKKKKIIRREDTPNNKIRRPAVKPSPESVHDIQKEIKGWFINKSVGETHLHRAARLGYTDCVAYCLEKMEAEPSAKDNAGFTPLHVAAAKGHVRIARLLLQYGANVSAAANGGIRPLHEACENCHVEVIRLLLSYGADPLLGTYAGQTPEELTEGPAARLLRLHIADVQGHAVEPWRFPPPAEIIDREELGCDPLSSPPPGSPPPPPDATFEMQCTEFPLPPFYSLKTATGQPAEGLWCLLQDITNLLQIKSKESLLKQIHCGSGSPKELLKEIRTQEFLERAQCHQLLCAGEKVNIRASKVALVRVTDKLRQLLKIETVIIS